MRRKFALIILVFILTIAFIVYNLIYQNNKSNFIPVTAVKAVYFEVPSNLSTKATAISSVSNSEEYNGIYVYKDGSSKYMLFDTASLVIACGPTSFNFANSETEETLESKSVEGIWSVSEKALNSDSKTNDGVYKIVCKDLISQFPITQMQNYNLKGCMATCSDGNVEYSIYVGAFITDSSHELSKEQTKTINHIVKSFTLADYNPSEADISEEKKIEASASIPENAKESTVYNPLNIGEWGIASAISADNKDIVESLKLDNIYTGEEAMNIIKENGGRKLEPTAGTSFVVAEYTSTVPIEKAYMDVRFTGVDGSRLVQNGISYTTRTYDIDGTEQLGGGYNLVTYKNRYVYYEVPDGCKEYMLVFGVHMDNVENIPTANYLITN